MLTSKIKIIHIISCFRETMGACIYSIYSNNGSDLGSIDIASKKFETVFKNI